MRSDNLVEEELTGEVVFTAGLEVDDARVVACWDVRGENLTLHDEGLLAGLEEARHHVQLPVHLFSVLDFPGLGRWRVRRRQKPLLLVWRLFAHRLFVPARRVRTGCIGGSSRAEIALRIGRVELLVHFREVYVLVADQKRLCIPQKRSLVPQLRSKQLPPVLHLVVFLHYSIHSVIVMCPFFIIQVLDVLNQLVYVVTLLQLF